ncbi:putative pumilio homolog 8, chloroplastic [Curcuma longa]|uniref:putative pumilio homolog 8, chloroplastic n=1 Tax=Curcuma longa TaxID=136217 RepID=UPI003D9EC7E8
MRNRAEEHDIEKLLDEIPHLCHRGVLYGPGGGGFRTSDELPTSGLHCNGGGCLWSEGVPSSLAERSLPLSGSGTGGISLCESDRTRRPAAIDATLEEALLLEKLRNVRLGADRNGPIDRFLPQTNHHRVGPSFGDSLVNENGNAPLPQIPQRYPGVVDLFGNPSFRTTELKIGQVSRPNSPFWGNDSGNFTHSGNGPYPISDMLFHSQMIRGEPCLVSGDRPVTMAPKISKGGLHSPRNQRNVQGTITKCLSFMSAKEQIYCFAKDQHGCRLLQQLLDEGKHQVNKIFNGIIERAVDLMVDPFGNYLIQKLLGKCSEEQMMAILLVLSKDPANLVAISLNIHGTRAVQKLIETVKTKQHISLVISTLRLGFLDLIKDLNGSHVLQRCLESFTTEDNQFIFDGAVTYCVEIATHRHGCCVLQKCIREFTGKHQEKLVAVIAANGFKLAQDPYGNYVVQAILDLEMPFANAILASQFQGKYVELSTQKFSSNVVERCFLHFGKDFPATIISEFLAVPHFGQFLQHPYANYPIQRALEYSKGQPRIALEKAIRPLAATLKTNPHCRQVFSKLLSKK